MKVFQGGYGDKAIEFDLGKYGFAAFELDGGKVHLGLTHGMLWLRVESMGGVIKVLPRVANEVYVGVEKT